MQIFGMDETYEVISNPPFHTIASVEDMAASKPPALRTALLQFMNFPHPLSMLSDYNSYGPNGSISRYHNPDNYTKALLALIGKAPHQVQPQQAPAKPEAGPKPEPMMASLARILRRETHSSHGHGHSKHRLRRASHVGHAHEDVEVNNN